MWKLSQQVILQSSLNYKYLTNEVKLAGTRLEALYQRWQTRPPSSSLQSGRRADSQPAESACSPRRAFHPAASALLRPHTHPSCLVGLSNPASPPTPPTSLCHSPLLPLPSLFLRSTGLVKVSQSPVALLYRLQCFLLKWRPVSVVYPCKEWLGSSSSFCLLHLTFGYFCLLLISGQLYYLVCIWLSGSAVFDHD